MLVGIWQSWSHCSLLKIKTAYHCSPGLICSECKLEGICIVLAATVCMTEHAGWSRMCGAGDADKTGYCQHNTTYSIIWIIHLNTENLRMEDKEQFLKLLSLLTVAATHSPLSRSCSLTSKLFLELDTFIALCYLTFTLWPFQAVLPFNLSQGRVL